MGAPASLLYAPNAVLDLIELTGWRDFAREEPADAVAAAREAARLGRERAADWVGRPLETELEKMGVEVRRLGCAPGGGGASVRVAAFTTYSSRPTGVRRVDLYLDEIARKHEALLDMGAEVSLDDLVGLHLAHEFYHVLEFSDGQRTEELVPMVRVHGLLGVRPRPPRRASEVAAHSFARIWMGRCPHPALVDALVLVASGVVSPEALQGRVNKALDLLNAYPTCD